MPEKKCATTAKKSFKSKLEIFYFLSQEKVNRERKGRILIKIGGLLTCLRVPPALTLCMNIFSSPRDTFIDSIIRCKIFFSFFLPTLLSHFCRKGQIWKLIQPPITSALYVCKIWLETRYILWMYLKGSYVYVQTSLKVSRFQPTSGLYLKTR